MKEDYYYDDTGMILRAVYLNEDEQEIIELLRDMNDRAAVYYLVYLIQMMSDKKE